MYGPYFSIIIPTFQSEMTLKTCLDSITQQVFRNFEIIIVDSLSNDETITIVREYSNRIENLRWITEKDEGVYDAMNKGIQMAKGEWLYFLGSDDRFHDNDVLKKIQKLRKSEGMAVYGNVNIVGNTTWALNGEIYDGQFDLEKLLKKNICHQAIFYHKDCFNNKTNLYNINYLLCADWDFNLRCWAHKRFLYADIIVADFFAGGNTTLTNEDLAFSLDFVKNLAKYFGPKYPIEIRNLLKVKSKTTHVAILKKLVKVIFHNK